MKLRGLRIDTAYFYDLYPGLSLHEIIKHVITDAKAGHVNTLFIYAYNPVYGALYPTDYQYTEVERGYGRANIFKELTLQAKNNGLKVVAVVPVNNFKTLWSAHPDWRSKARGGTDYIPVQDMYLLSAWHPDFRSWLAGFYKDLLQRNPDIDGIEAVEPFVDYNWDQESDYNHAVNSRFKALFPNGKQGDLNWLNFRAQGLTELIGIMNSAAYSYKKATYLVQTWPARADGRLYSSDVIKKNIGLDLDAVLNLSGPEKLHFLMAEIMWQQWAAEYGPRNFAPAWTRQAALDFIRFVNFRTEALVHLELSSFTGARGSVKPTLEEFKKTLESVRDLNIGVEVYDHSQIENADAWPMLHYWY